MLEKPILVPYEHSNMIQYDTKKDIPNKLNTTVMLNSHENVENGVLYSSSFGEIIVDKEASNQKQI